MRPSRFISVFAALLLGVSCGADEPGGGDSTTTDTAITTPTTTTTTTTTAPPTTSNPPTSTDIAPSTTEAQTLAQPAIWPAADVVFSTPEEAAADFVRSVLGVEPFLGEYQGGDSRSGEIEVFSPGEGGAPVSRAILDLRVLAPSDGWFVLDAANPNATISSPEANAEVPAGPVTVAGVARGFEGTVVVTAFHAGDAEAVFDHIITSGGALETPEPYSVMVDLTGAEVGDVITLLVHGDTGLENDPGEFGAIAVVVAG